MQSSKRVSRAAVVEAIAYVAGSMAQDLTAQAIKLLDNTTQDERDRILTSVDGQQYPVRLAKALLVALVNDGRIDRQYNAEAMRADVRRLQRIIRNRP